MTLEEDPGNFGRKDIGGLNWKKLNRPQSFGINLDRYTEPIVSQTIHWFIYVSKFPTYDANNSKSCAVIVVEMVELLMELQRRLSIHVGNVLLQQISHLFGHSIKSTPNNNQMLPVFIKSGCLQTFKVTLFSLVSVIWEEYFTMSWLNVIFWSAQMQNVATLDFLPVEFNISKNMVLWELLSW